MDIEIYMPCNPDWFCDALLWSFLVIAVAGFLLFVVVLYKEYQQIQTPRKRRRKNNK